MASPKKQLKEIEDVFRQQDYVIRYEKGNFNSGYCMVHDKKIVIINKFFKVDARLHCLKEILKKIKLPISISI